MSGSDYSGWGGDDKGAPMVVVAPSGGDGGGGSGRTTTVLLVTAMVFALGLAGYSMWRLDRSSTDQKTAIGLLNKQHAAELDVLKDKLTRARASVLEDKDYAENLARDNASMREKGRVVLVDPPQPPERQRYIDELQEENKALRKSPRSAVKQTTRRTVDLFGGG